jgi:transposase-like protein
MKKDHRRRHDRAFKLWVVGRIESGERVGALSLELGIRDNLLYRWRNAVRAGGEEALRDPGRPGHVADEAVQGAVGEIRDVATAQRRIEALQRKIGEQQVALDFFKGALRRIEASRQPNDGPGVTTSSPRSRR